MAKRGNIVKEERVINRLGKTITYYTYYNKAKALLDGESYIVLAKYMKFKNNFSMYNPEYYYKQLPEIDEIGFYNEIITLIKSKFNIWKD